jgi:hypothetical protein
MIEPHLQQVAFGTSRKFQWEYLLPRRRAWIKTLVLMPFVLPLANFLGSSFNFSRETIASEGQYVLGIGSLLLSGTIVTIAIALCTHWCWYIWKQNNRTWYPRSKALWTGFYTMLTIAISFGIVTSLSNSLGVCENENSAGIVRSLMCNLDKNYGFESKSMFGLWFIIAAYLYQLEAGIRSTWHQPPTDLASVNSIDSYPAGELEIESPTVERPETDTPIGIDR